MTSTERGNGLAMPRELLRAADRELDAYKDQVRKGHICSQ